jgi:hypothetical protein
MTHLDQDNVGTGFSKTNGNGLANATSAASNDGRLALEGEECCRHRKRERIDRVVFDTEVQSRGGRASVVLMEI